MNLAAAVVAKTVQDASKMKITKRQLRRIIKEEKQKLLKEQYGDVEHGSLLIDFAQAFAGLGGAVQEQLMSVTKVYLVDGGQPDELDDVIYQQNPSALEMALERLRGPLEDLRGHEEVDYLLDMFEEIEERLRNM